MDQTERKSRLPRKLLGLCLLVELVSLPAAAQIVDRVSFRASPTVIVTELPLQPKGARSFLVATNTPFAVEVGGVVGDVGVEVSHTGWFGDLRYGSKAQMPGPRATCTEGRPEPVVAYRADRRTAAVRGDVRSHAVRVHVSYSALAAPEVRIVAAEASTAPIGNNERRRCGAATFLAETAP